MKKDKIRSRVRGGIQSERGLKTVRTIHFKVGMGSDFVEFMTKDFAEISKTKGKRVVVVVKYLDGRNKRTPVVKRKHFQFDGFPETKIEDK